MSPAEHKSSAEKTRVFISYSRKDMVVADRLEAALKERGVEPLIDRTEIYAFEDWWRRIQALIARADTVIFLISPDAVISETCKKEVEFAASLNKRFAPIVVRGTSDRAIPDQLRRLNFIFLDEKANFAAAVDQLVEAMTTDIVWIRKHTELGARALLWAISVRSGFQPALLRPPELDDAEAWLAATPEGAPAPTEDVKAFILESRNAEIDAQARAQDRRRFTRGLLLMLIPAMIIGVWALDRELREMLYKPVYEWLVPSIYLSAFLWDIAPAPLAIETERVLTTRSEFQECANCPEMIVVPAGEFMMGLSTAPAVSNFYNDAWVDEARANLSRPERRVRIPEPFAVSKFEVTFNNYDACAAHGHCRPLVEFEIYHSNMRGRLPVSKLTWGEAQTYIMWLSRLTGKRYRLLSEAEWEFVAGAGKSTAFVWGNEFQKYKANCFACLDFGASVPWNVPSGTVYSMPVGKFEPNGFGLFDIDGNVSEWVEDDWHENYVNAPTDGSAWVGNPRSDLKVIRGGNHFTDWKADLWVARRFAPKTGVDRTYSDGGTEFKDLRVGFRVARTLDIKRSDGRSP